MITYRQLEKFQVIVFTNNAKNGNLEPGLGTRNFEMILRFSKSGKFQVTVWEPNSENFSELNFAAPFFLQSENSCWIYQVLVASKLYVF